MTDNRKAVIISLGTGGANILRTAHDVIQGSSLKRHLDSRTIQLVALDTNSRHLAQKFSSETKVTPIVLGEQLCKGGGAGSDPKIGELAFVESRQALLELLKKEQFTAAIVIATLGKGTGAGSFEPLLKLLREDLEIDLSFLVLVEPSQTAGQYGPKQRTYAGQVEKRLLAGGVRYFNPDNDWLYNAVDAQKTLPQVLDEVNRQLVTGILDMTDWLLFSVDPDPNDTRNLLLKGKGKLRALKLTLRTSEEINDSIQNIRNNKLFKFEMTRTFGVISNFREDWPAKLSGEFSAAFQKALNEDSKDASYTYIEGHNPSMKINQTQEDSPQNSTKEYTVTIVMADNSGEPEVQKLLESSEPPEQITTPTAEPEVQSDPPVQLPPSAPEPETLPALEPVVVAQAPSTTNGNGTKRESPFSSLKELLNAADRHHNAYARTILTSDIVESSTGTAPGISFKTNGSEWSAQVIDNLETLGRLAVTPGRRVEFSETWRQRFRHGLAGIQLPRTLGGKPIVYSTPISTLQTDFNWNNEKRHRQERITQGCRIYQLLGEDAVKELLEPVNQPERGSLMSWKQRVQ